jgi:hypothetical protein
MPGSTSKIVVSSRFNFFASIRPTLNFEVIYPACTLEALISNSPLLKFAEIMPNSLAVISAAIMGSCDFRETFFADVFGN